RHLPREHSPIVVVVPEVPEVLVLAVSRQLVSPVKVLREGVPLDRKTLSVIARRRLPAAVEMSYAPVGRPFEHWKGVPLASELVQIPQTVDRFVPRVVREVQLLGRGGVVGRSVRVEGLYPFPHEAYCLVSHGRVAGRLIHACHSAQILPEDRDQ